MRKGTGFILGVCQVLASLASARSRSLPYGSQGQRAMQPGLGLVVMVFEFLLECAREAFTLWVQNRIRGRGTGDQEK